jgi:hypothetical protein
MASVQQRSVDKANKRINEILSLNAVAMNNALAKNSTDTNQTWDAKRISLPFIWKEKGWGSIRM